MQSVQLVMMKLRMEMKMASIVADHVLPAQVAVIKFKIKVKPMLIAVDHVPLPAQLAVMDFRIKMRLVSIAEEDVKLAVRKQYNSC